MTPDPVSISKHSMPAFERKRCKYRETPRSLQQALCGALALS